MNTQNFPLLSYRTITGRETRKSQIFHTKRSKFRNSKFRKKRFLRTEFWHKRLELITKRIGILHNCYDLIHLSPNGKWSLQMDLNKNHGTTFKSFRSLKDLKENLERNIGYILDDWEDLL